VTEPDKPTNPSGGDGGWKTLEGLGKAAIALGYLVFASGWSYIHAYYQVFGLGMKEINIPITDVLIFSIPVFKHSWISDLIMGTILFVIISLLIFDKLPLLVRLALGIVALVVGFLFLSRFSGTVGAENALRDLQEETTTLPNVQIVVDKTNFKIDLSDPPFENGNFRFLLRANGMIYFFQPLSEAITETKNVPTRNIRIYAVPESRVQEIRIERGS
jgi:hypothetical protein